MHDDTEDGTATITRDTTADLSIACSLTDRALAERAERFRAELFAGAAERTALPEGYAFRFDGTPDWAERIAAFIAAERECCRFLRFEVAYTPDLGPIDLRLTGPAGTRAFLDGLMGLDPS